MSRRTILLFLLILACLGVQSVSAATIVYDIQAVIDGRSLLLMQGSTLQWHNLSFTVPGQHSGDNPTILSSTLNGVPVMNAVQWWPNWPGGTSGDQLSDVFNSLDPALPGATIASISLDVISGREALSIYQAPTSGNGYQLILDFDDTVTGGSAWYDARLTVNTRDEIGQIPEPGTAVMLGAGLLLIFLRRGRK
ncbi:MAG: PEP-CTERM sorting domain-containing protein [Acidobacteria bacterium]|nr:PEP-CTERM sorting domain-containing protein [Acidobacteriota bacterium]